MRTSFGPSHPLPHALLLGLFGLTALLAGCQPAPADAPPRLIAYVMGARSATVSPAAARQLTHINYAFANVTPDGHVVLEHAQDALRLARLRALKQHHADLKLLLSVGGWAWSDHFSDAALTESARQRFARSAVRLVKTHRLDGLDIDWEYPGQRGQDNAFRPEDKQNFTLLLKAVRTRLDSLAQTRVDGDSLLLTIAAATDSTYLAHTEMAAAQPYLDFVNLMTYDFHGSWTPRTGHHANLYPSAADTGAVHSADRAVNRFLAAGVPADKLVIGAAFYGRRWRGVTRKRHGLYQPYDTALAALPYDTLAAAFIGQQGFTRYWDEAAQAPYLWNSTSATFITYDDPASLHAKADYVRTRGLGGVMYWEHSHDPDGRLLDALYESLQ